MLHSFTKADYDATGHFKSGGNELDMRRLYGLLYTLTFEEISIPDKSYFVPIYGIQPVSEPTMVGG